MLADSDADRVSRVETGDDFGVPGTDGLDGFGNSGFFQKHGLGAAEITCSLVVDAGGFEMDQVAGGDSVELIQAENFFVGVFGFGFETCFHKGPAQAVESFDVMATLFQYRKIDFYGLFPVSGESGVDG